MIPSSVSASSLTTSRLCKARYKAENIDYVRGWDKPAAKLGTTLHSALEMYVKEVYVDHRSLPSPITLASIFELLFLKEYGIEGDPEIKATGLAMCARWSEKEPTHMMGREILSLEEKKFILIETSAGPIKLNYILDRFDRIGPNRYEVIDYKSSFFNETERSMRSLLQVFIYALAKYIEHSDAELMLVTFDMLRYKPVTIEVTKEEARQAFATVCNLIEDILATDENNPPETINKSCNFCVRKTGCKTLQKNINVGGLFSLDLQGQIDLRTELELKIKGLKALQTELDELVEESLGKSLMTELETGKSRAHFVVPRKNEIKNIPLIARKLGLDEFLRFGKVDITQEQFKKLLKEEKLDSVTKAELEALLESGYSDPKLKFENTRNDDVTAAIAPDLTGKLKAAEPAAPIPGLED